MKEQVAGGFDLQVAKKCSTLGADTADVLHGSQQPVGGDRSGAERRRGCGGGGVGGGV
jgi:hypothetical protein